MRILLVLLLALAITSPAAAQPCQMPVTVSPPNPTNQTSVTLSFFGYLRLFSTLTYQVEGNVVMIDHKWDLFIMPGYEARSVTIGRLTPGTYQVRFVRSFNDLSDSELCGVFTVSAAANAEGIPALSLSHLLILAAGLSLIGAARVAS